MENCGKIRRIVCSSNKDPLTKLLHVVLLPGDVQQEDVLLLVLGEDLLLDPGEVLGVLHNLLQAVDHDLLGLVQRGRELDPGLHHQRHVDHGVGEEHHVVVLALDTVALLQQQHNFTLTFRYIYKVWVMVMPVIRNVCGSALLVCSVVAAVYSEEPCADSRRQLKREVDENIKFLTSEYCHTLPHQKYIQWDIFYSSL